MSLALLLSPANPPAPAPVVTVGEELTAQAGTAVSMLASIEPGLTAGVPALPGPIRQLTATPGSGLTLAGSIEPGFVMGGSATSIAPIVLQVPDFQGVPLRVRPGDTFQVTPATASQLARDDPTWWVFR